MKKFIYQKLVVFSLLVLLLNGCGEEFLELASKIPVHTEIETFPLAKANEALARLKGGRIRGAIVLVID